MCQDFTPLPDWRHRKMGIAGVKTNLESNRDINHYSLLTLSAIFMNKVDDPTKFKDWKLSQCILWADRDLIRAIDRSQPGNDSKRL